jgi:hypothetical protein
LPIVDDQSEVSLVIGRLAPARGEIHELIAEVDESHAIAAPAQLELEQFAVEFERGVDIIDFEGNVVDADGAGLAWFTNDGSDSWRMLTQI